MVISDEARIWGLLGDKLLERDCVMAAIQRLRWERDDQERNEQLRLSALAWLEEQEDNAARKKLARESRWQDLCRLAFGILLGFMAGMAIHATVAGATGR